MELQNEIKAWTLALALVLFVLPWVDFYLPTRKILHYVFVHILRLKFSHDSLLAHTLILLKLIKRTQMLLYFYQLITYNTLNYCILLQCQQYRLLIFTLWYLSPKCSILKRDQFIACDITLLLIRSMEMLYLDDCRVVYIYIDVYILKK